MIELIRTETCTECAAVKAQLDDMGVEYTVTTVAGASDDVPMLRSGDQVVPRDEIKRYLAELGRPVDQWEHFREDTEYVNGAA